MIILGSTILFGASRTYLGVEDLTRGHFRTSLNGCLKNIKIQVITMIKDRMFTAFVLPGLHRANTTKQRICTLVPFSKIMTNE